MNRAISILHGGVPGGGGVLQHGGHGGITEEIRRIEGVFDPRLRALETAFLRVASVSSVLKSDACSRTAARLGEVA
jgi:hypothetical protein